MKLCDLVVKAVTMVVDEDGTVDTENIKVEKKVGGGIRRLRDCRGSGHRQGTGPPQHAQEGRRTRRSLLLNAAIEFKKTEVDAKINITSPDQLQAFLDEEERMVKDIVDKIVQAAQTSSSARRASTTSPSTTWPRQASLQSAGSRRATWRSSPGQPAQAVVSIHRRIAKRRARQGRPCRGEKGRRTRR